MPGNQEKTRLIASLWALEHSSVLVKVRKSGTQMMSALNT